MATLAARPRLKVRTDDLFFSGMALISLVAVFIGFAPTYYLAGMFHARLPNLLVHIHGAVFTLWIVLFVCQIWLVTIRRISLHRTLGLLSFGLAVLMVVLGVLVASDRLTRHVGEPGKDLPEEVRAFYAIPMGDMLIFSVFVFLGYRNRNRPAEHKRLMLFATFALLDAAFDRWPIFDPYPLAVVNLICFVPLVLLVMAYDWRSSGGLSSGKVQRVTLWSALFLLAGQGSRHLIGPTAGFQSLAAWVQTHMPALR